MQYGFKSNYEEEIRPKKKKPKFIAQPVTEIAKPRRKKIKPQVRVFSFFPEYLARELTKYAKDNFMSKSSAIRFLVGKQLKASGYCEHITLGEAEEPDDYD